MAWAGDDVVFDYVGALALARQLWVLADTVDWYWDDRESASETALTDWSGVFRDQFVDRRAGERSSTPAVVEGLRGDARLWAQAWASAMNEQNRVLWARHRDKVKNDRSLFQRGIDVVNGFDDDTPHPPPVGVPVSPDFAATASLVSY